MIKKVFLPSIFLLMIGLVAFANGNNLYEHFNAHLPSLDERALIYYNAGFEDEYVGSKEQNQSLHNYFDSFENEGVFGALAFPPSTVEGTSTAGWTDDGSNVRLNTASDFVGIGTTNPAQKLTVQNGNFQVSGNIQMSGGTFTFGGLSGTSTLTVGNSGRLGIGTTTPTSTFSAQGDATFSGTTTTANLVVASSTTQINGIPWKWPSGDGTNGQLFTTNGGGTISFTTVNTGTTTFGGDASDGALNITSGTTTISLGGQAVVEKNYSSINISAGAGLDFSNPYSGGTVLILRSQGAVTIAGTIRGNFGSAGAATTTIDTTNGFAGSDSDDILDDNTHFGGGGKINNVGTGGAGGLVGLIFNASSTAAKATPYSTSTTYLYRRVITLQPGAGGGGGAHGAGPGSLGSAGGRGGGALLIEAGGAWNFTGTINLNGSIGNPNTITDNDSTEGGGGGGGGGMLVTLYGVLTANTGTVMISGGAGGKSDVALTTGTNGGFGGGGGGGSINGAGGVGGAGGDANLNGNAGSTGDGLNGGAGGAGGTSDGSSDGGNGGGGGGGSGSSLIAKNKWF